VKTQNYGFMPAHLNRYSVICVNFILICAILLLAGSAFAQLQFKNSLNNEIVRITQSGLVGIGTTAPSSPLTIQNLVGYDLLLAGTYGWIFSPIIGWWSNTSADLLPAYRTAW